MAGLIAMQKVEGSNPFSRFPLMKRLLLLSMLAFVVLASASARSLVTVQCQYEGPKSKPSACVFYGDPDIEGTYVKGLRWKQWGGKAAIGHGIYHGNMNVTKPIRVRLSGKRLCQPGEPSVYVYTQAALKYKGDPGTMVAYWWAATDSRSKKTPLGSLAAVKVALRKRCCAAVA
jgi:hypothetical protein